MTTLNDTDLFACGFDSRPTGHCPRRDADVPLRLSRSGPHVRGDCAVCGGYVRFVKQPQGADTASLTRQIGTLMQSYLERGLSVTELREVLDEAEKHLTRPTLRVEDSR